MHEAKLYKTVRSIFILFLFTLILTSCGGGGGGSTNNPPANAAPTASNLSISDANNGAAVPGDTLTGDYTYTDAENDVEGLSTFRWLRNGTAISGATSLSYTLVTADNDQIITFEVTPIATDGTITGNAVVSNAITVGNFAPTAINVNITGSSAGGAVTGDSLTGNYTYADTENDAEGLSTFQWLRNGTAISGATSINYTLTIADSGQPVSFRVTPVAATGTATGNAVISTNSITIVNSAPIANTVTISGGNAGNAVVGDSLTGNYTYADIENDAEAASTFRWLRNGTAISGATAKSYTLVAADSGQPISFEVTPVAVTGTSTGSATTSSNTITVINSAPTATNINITGSTVVGGTLTGSYTFIDLDNDSEGVTTFRWLRNGSAIAGATAKNYTLVIADSGQSITFEVTAVALTGITTGNAITSSTGITVINSAPTASSVNITGDGSVAGNVLTGNYTFVDLDGDSEGASVFRWLRDGVVISGATVKNYTLIAADIPAQITFEVTPVALTGNTNGNAVISVPVQTGNTPVVTGVARYLDINMNGINDANDQIIIPFDQDVTANTAAANDFSLPVTGDSFGTGATVNSGPASNEITITLGSSPNLKTRQNFSATATTTNSASGIDVSASMTAGAIQGTNGLDAVQSAAIDIIPAYVNSLQSLAAANDSRAIAVGDVDGDGDLDMVLANKDQANQVYKNNGNGTFSVFTQSTPLGSNDSRNIALGDLDGDGDLDMVVANLNQGNRVYLNSDGKGNFTDSGQSLGSNSSYSVALGDIDADGDLDMVVANLGQGNQVYKNNGSGTFATSSQSLGTNSSFAIALGDMDNDGDLDIVVANSAISAAVTSKIYPNDGNGNFGTAISLPGSNSSVSVALGDLNNDNSLDIVLINNSPAGSRVLFNNGSGSFSQSSQSLGGSNVSIFGSLGDMDGDGDLDIVIANTINGNRVYHNDGNGSFTDSGQPLDLNSSYAVALGDIDNDGDLDIMSANLAAQGNQVFLNSLSATWGSATYADSTQSLGSNDSTSIALGDVDSDGDLDMVVANNGANQIYKNNSSGSFGAPSALPGTDNSNSVALGDIDGDGDLDAVFANIGDNRVYLNNGGGAFTDSGQLLGGTNMSTAIALGDIDTDGDLDIVTANNGTQGNRVYLNDGSGSFTDSTQSLGTNNSQSIALGDIDNDGDLDMVVANHGEANRIYKNNGSGIFSDSGQSLGSSNSFFTALKDLDSDGDLDLLVANGGQNNLVYLNNGSGTFTVTSQLLGGTNNSNSIALGDIDGDGSPDMIIANEINNQVYSNNGSGSFSTFGPSLGTNNSASVILGDLDGDGDLDIVEANRNSQSNKVYFSQ